MIQKGVGIVESVECVKCKKTKKFVRGNKQASEFYEVGQGRDPYGPRRICKECDKARRRAETVRKRALRPEHIPESVYNARYVKRPQNETTVYIRHCPDETWPSDRYFNGMEFHAMLEDGYLTAGMLVEIAEIEYIILGKQLESQWMIPA